MRGDAAVYHPALSARNSGSIKHFLARIPYPSEARLQVIEHVHKGVFLLCERVDVHGNDRWRIALHLLSNDDPRVAMRESPPIGPEMPCVVKQFEVVRVMGDQDPIMLRSVEELMWVGRAFATFVVRGNHHISVIAQESIEEIGNIFVHIERYHAGSAFAVEHEASINGRFVPFIVCKRGVHCFARDAIIVCYLVYVAFNNIKMPNKRPNRKMTVRGQPGIRCPRFAGVWFNILGDQCIRVVSLCRCHHCRSSFLHCMTLGNREQRASARVPRNPRLNRFDLRGILPLRPATGR